MDPNQRRGRSLPPGPGSAVEGSWGSTKELLENGMHSAVQTFIYLFCLRDGRSLGTPFSSESVDTSYVPSLAVLPRRLCPSGPYPLRRRTRLRPPLVVGAEGNPGVDSVVAQSEVSVSRIETVAPVQTSRGVNSLPNTTIGWGPHDLPVSLNYILFTKPVSGRVPGTLKYTSVTGSRSTVTTLLRWEVGSRPRGYQSFQGR